MNEANRNGEALVREFWPDPFAAPAGRAHLVEKMA